MGISEIKIKDALPKVFRGENHKGSDVWMSDLTLLKGRRYVISAESGTGKSSLCSYIYGARRDYDGSIYFDGSDVASFSIGRWQELRRTSLAYLPQELGLFPELSAIDNIMLKNDLTGHYTLEKIDSMLARLGVAERRNFPVGKMSVGQQQRVAVIRALCQPFDFILLDEPVSHLDEQNNRIAAALIEEEAEARDAAIVATSVGNHLLLSEAKYLYL